MCRSISSLCNFAVSNILINNCHMITGELKSSFIDRNEVANRVLEVVKRFDKVDYSKMSLNSHFLNDLGLDSLDTVEIVMALEEEFGYEIPDAVAEKIVTPKDAVYFFSIIPESVRGNRC